MVIVGTIPAQLASICLSISCVLRINGMAITLVIQFDLEHDPSVLNSIPSHHNIASANCILETAMRNNALVLSHLTLRFIRYPAITQEKVPVSKDTSKFQHMFVDCKCHLSRKGIRQTCNEFHLLSELAVISPNY